MMKSYPPEPSGITLLTAPEGSPDETVSLIRSEGFKFLAGINHNTSIYNYHTDEHHYYMLIACKELHWLVMVSRVMVMVVRAVLVRTSSLIRLVKVLVFG